MHVQFDSSLATTMNRRKFTLNFIPVNFLVWTSNSDRGSPRPFSA